jgi:photoactive yellow protein
MDYMKFGSEDVGNLLQQEPHRAEYLPFGAVLVDKSGNIIRYNQAESMLTGRNPGDVLGKNFFEDIAPCAKGQKFHGKFLEGARSGQINTMFEYAFDYKMDPIKVRIPMQSEPSGEGIWIFIKRM